MIDKIITFAVAVSLQIPSIDWTLHEEHTEPTEHIEIVHVKVLNAEGEIIDELQYDAGA